MLFWLVLSLTILTGAMLIVATKMNYYHCKKCNEYYGTNSDNAKALRRYHDNLSDSWEKVFEYNKCTLILLIVVLAIMLLILGVSHCGFSARCAVTEQSYTDLQEIVYNADYRDKLGITTIQVADSVRDWNTEVVYYREMSSNFWYGIFCPNVYKNVDVIPLSAIEMGS